MNSVLSSTGQSGDAVFGPISSVAASSRRLRHQMALMNLGRRDLCKLSQTELAYEVLSLVAKTLDTSLCAIVEVPPTITAPLVEQVDCVPPEAAHAGLKPGDPLSGDKLLHQVFHNSRLIVKDVQTEARFLHTWCHRLGVRSAIALLLELNNQPLGILIAGSATQNLYDEDDLIFLEFVGNAFTANVARSKAEVALRAEQEYLSALLDSTSALTVIATADGVVRRVNRACLTSAGLKEHQVVGQPFWLSLCTSTESRLAEASFAQLSQGVSAVEFESTLLTADGEKRYIGWRMCYLMETHDRAGRIVATGIDMTRQRRAEQEARQAIMAAETARRLVDELRSVQSPSRQTTLKQEELAEDASHFLSVSRGSDRRTSPRKLFPYRQKIAPYDQGIVPPRGSFQLVRCWDISAGGISFLLEEVPQFRSLVVVLGSGASEVLMSADVARIEELSENGISGFLVGCKFTGKL